MNSSEEIIIMSTASGLMTIIHCFSYYIYYGYLLLVYYIVMIYRTQQCEDSSVKLRVVITNIYPIVLYFTSVTRYVAFLKTSSF
ncbi:MAG: hypothetical protein ACI90V_010494 [Bacillariaceae sp.]|jgi:hypothetical protein